MRTDTPSPLLKRLFAPVQAVLDALQLPRTPVALMVDGAAAAAAFALALLLRYDFTLPEAALPYLLYATPAYALLALCAFAAVGLHRSVWRYTATRDLSRLLQAVTAAVLLLAAGLFLLTRLEHFPRSAFIILWFLHVAFAAGPRLLRKMMAEYTGRPTHGRADVTHALVVGANDAAESFLRELNRRPDRRVLVHGLLDDDKAKHRRLIHGIPVLGPIATLSTRLARFGKQDIPISLVILAGQNYTQLEGLLKVARANKLAVKRLPSFEALQEGEEVTNLRPVLIEDLLGRKPVQLDADAIGGLVTGRRVLITGAGGSIGSELVRQIARRAPERLILVDSSEFALYEMEAELKRTPEWRAIPRHIALMDVQEEAALSRLLVREPADILFHAAAYKHVPMVEENAVAGIANNFLGTARVAEAAKAHNVPRMVLISTDKAVNPVNVMGASKRAAEIYLQSQPVPLVGEAEAGPEGGGAGAAEEGIEGGAEGAATRFITVRFGNVLGSTGSVVPLFTRQIREGGPVTVTDKRATRYFMTIPEAAQLVLQAAAQGQGGEIFMLNMGEPVNIWSMAEEMIRLSGLTPGVDIELTETGLRPGEKLFEELWYDDEHMEKTAHEDIFRVRAGGTLDEMTLKAHTDVLTAAVAAQNDESAVAGLRRLVGEYKPAENSPFHIPEKPNQE